MWTPLWRELTFETVIWCEARRQVLGVFPEQGSVVELQEQEPELDNREDLDKLKQLFVQTPHGKAEATAVEGNSKQAAEETPQKKKKKV
ncbi:uncharacterized protein V6R79_014885 [Siganus canaliculatus]